MPPNLSIFPKLEDISVDEYNIYLSSFIIKSKITAQYLVHSHLYHEALFRSNVTKEEYSEYCKFSVTFVIFL